MKISRLLVVFLGLLLLGAAKPEPIVTVVKTDGTLVRGHLSDSDPTELTITPLPKPHDTQTPEPQKVSWKDIKTVSNGLTRAKVLQQWKQEHAANLCETCRGNGTLRCDTCKGTGHDPAASANCPTCKGELLVNCKAPQCKDGKVPCPGPCIKLSEGHWYVKDGKRWRNFQKGRATFMISESHLGEVFELDPASGPQSKGKCPICGGTTVVDCAVCGGTAKMPCPVCKNNTKAAACPAGCDHGEVSCPTCAGTGLKKA